MWSYHVTGEDWNRTGDRFFCHGHNSRGKYQHSRDGAKDYFFPSMLTMAQFTPSENFFAQASGTISHKDKHGLHCQYADRGWLIKPRELWAEICLESFTVRFGRQILAFGNQLVLDNRFDSVELALDNEKLDVSLLGGVLAVDVVREGRSCLREAVYENRPCWKGFCNANWGDFWMAGATIAPRLSRQHRTQLLLLHQGTPDGRDAAFCQSVCEWQVVPKR
jgi:hypothetical protein